MYYKKIEEVAEAEFVGVSERSLTWEMRELREENHFLKTDNDLLKMENEEFDKRISRIEKLNDTLLEQNEMLLDKMDKPNRKEWKAFYVGAMLGMGAILALMYLVEIFPKLW